METFSIGMLGCEITPEVGNLISTNNIEALSNFKHPNCSSGVLTAGHIPLIRSLKSPPVYFDYTKNDGFDTDLKFRTDKMVERFCSQYTLEESNKILLTCGDSHAMLQEIIAGDQKFEPFALKLKERGYRVLPIKMHYKNGFTGYWRNWGNWDEDIPQEVDESTPQTLEMTFENGFFTLKINNLHKGTVPNMLTDLEI